MRLHAHSTYTAWVYAMCNEESLISYAAVAKKADATLCTHLTMDM